MCLHNVGTNEGETEELPYEVGSDVDKTYLGGSLRWERIIYITEVWSMNGFLYNRIILLLYNIYIAQI